MMLLQLNGPLGHVLDGMKLTRNGPLGQLCYRGLVTPPRPRRADAARNRALLLAAAADEFAERGLDASVADIARRAGVGKGTVFRHFATKDDLLAAIVLDRVNALNAVGDRLLDAADPGAALLEFLPAAADQRQQRDLSFLQEAGELSPEVTRVRAQLFQ